MIPPYKWKANNLINLKVEENERYVVLHIAGILFIDNIKETEKIWTEQVNKSPDMIAINCDKLELIDSTAIGSLVKLLNMAIARNIKLVIYDMNPAIKNLFETAKLHNYFEITSKEKFLKLAKTYHPAAQ